MLALNASVTMCCIKILLGEKVIIKNKLEFFTMQGVFAILFIELTLSCVIVINISVISPFVDKQAAFPLYKNIGKIKSGDFV